ncbi:Rv2175c family DNA-binding protein [Angustibacter peucedani]
MDDLETLVDEWLTVPDVADRLGVADTKVRQLLQEGALLAVRRGERNVVSVPALLLGAEGLLPELPGTVTVLADAGFDTDETLRWLFAPDDTITGGSPIAALHAGHKTEVRRRAQALAV